MWEGWFGRDLKGGEKQVLFFRNSVAYKSHCAGRLASLLQRRR